MTTLTDALRKVERSVAKEKGPFTLFALMLPEDKPLEIWDLVVAAPWIEKDRALAMKLLADRVTSSLDSEGLLMISRIVLADPYDPAVDAIGREIKVGRSPVLVKDETFFGYPMKRAHFFAARRARARVRRAGSGRASHRPRRKRSRA
jgi:hypothetical protein